MAMIKNWIKLCSSKNCRPEHAVAHAMGYIKLQPVFCLFRQTWHTIFKTILVGCPWVLTFRGECWLMLGSILILKEHISVIQLVDTLPAFWGHYRYKKYINCNMHGIYSAWHYVLRCLTTQQCWPRIAVTSVCQCICWCHLVVWTRSFGGSKKIYEEHLL